MVGHIFSNPDKYSKNNALQYNFATKLLSKLSFDNHSRVLDIGCGDGSITHEIAKIVPKGSVIGTDLSQTMIEFASRKFITQENLGFLTMDASKNFFREQFDIITSFNCLHWVNDQMKALEGIAKSAIPGAQIAILLSHKKSLYHLVLDEICSRPKWCNYFSNYINPRSFFEQEEYHAMLIKAGLQVNLLLEEEMTYVFKSKDQLKDFFNAAGSQIKQIPESRKEEFLDEFAAEFLDKSKCPADCIPVGFYCLQILATKPVPMLLNNEDLNYQPQLFARL